MTMIYEALEKASREKVAKDEKPELVCIPRESPAQELESAISETMTGLYHNIDSMLSESSTRAVQFIGSRPGEGTSVIVREFAKVVSRKMNRSVLLFDADPNAATQMCRFGITQELGWDSVIEHNTLAADLVHRIGSTQLFLSQIATNSTLSAVLGSMTFDMILSDLKDRYGMILFDSPPLSVCPAGLALSRKVDGVVIVIEAGKTRWQEVSYAREEITRQGGNVIGAILNKQRHYIPRAIYDRL